MNELQPHEQRVFDENADLIVKIFKLAEFIDSNEFDSNELFRSLDSVDQQLLVNQLYIMNRYSDILEARITGFKS